MKKQNKPEKKTISYWDYSEVISYVEKKYGFNADDYGNRFGINSKGKPTKVDEDAPYLDFWNWLVNRCETANGRMDTLPILEWINEEYDPIETWVKEILQYIYNEFKEDEMTVKFEW